MKEIEDIIRSFDNAEKHGKKTALATVVHVEGSSYRRPGARMLITEEGVLTGAISGGCLEGDALRKALLVIMQHQSMLVTYDTSDEADSVMGLGLGCNGIIQVLIEPIDATKINHPIALLKMVARKRRNASLVTLFCLGDKKKPQPGTCLLLTDTESAIGDELVPVELLTALAKEVLTTGRSSFKNYILRTEEFTAFTEFIPPPVSLVIIGAGNDIIPLAAMSAILGWTTTIIDGRPAYAKQERFAASCQVPLAKPEQVLRQISVDERTAAVLMTHNYQYDFAVLRLLIQTGISYIGMLGPKKKFDRMIQDLADQDIILSAGQLNTIHSPVGLNIGAETAEEIALSVLAESKAVFAAAQPMPLKDNKLPIHNRAGLAIEQMILSPEK